MSKKLRIGLILATAMSCIAGVLFIPPIAQDPAYHDFSDGRTWLGIPNFANVASNFLFIVMGACGLYTVGHRSQQYKTGEYAAWMIFFFGVLLTGFGSAYYHWSPDNNTLVWDRLPMTIAFMSLLSFIIMERINVRIGFALLPVFVFTGLLSVGYWHYTESLGQGDLRPYALVQFLPMVLIGLILVLFPLRDGRTKYLIYVFAWYALAKLLEHYDDQVYSLLGNTVSGHPLKHLAAAAGMWWMIKYARK
jgi:hypothetical protein